MVAGQRPGSLLGQLLHPGCSAGCSTQNHMMGKQEEEASTKCSKPAPRVGSLASLLPPVKATSLKRISQTLQFLSLQRSISFRNENRADRASPPPPPPPPSSSSSSSVMKTRTISATVSNVSACMTAPRVATATAPASKRRDSKLWSETFDIRVGATQTLSPKEIKRQEAIFELAQGEQDLVEDLKLAKKAYHDPMLKLSIMTEQELNQIFGTLDSLIPLHEDLLSRLRDARKPDGSTENVGHILTGWLPRPGYKHPPPNGCGSPLFGFQFDFGIPSMTKCCNRHDRCYDTCGQEKHDCDEQFQDCLETICRNVQRTLGLAQSVQACESAVTLLFDAVMHLGCKPYLDSQREACVCQYEVKKEL